jgi:sigma-B regulation protein RsbU (phosphoserine phosphatase)
VFTLPSGWLGIVVGDVSGHGLASAVVMGRVRRALRAYALITDDPAEALTMLDRKVHHFEAGSLTTALYAMIAPDRRTVRMCSAGHLRPVLAVPGRPTALVEVPVGAPLGVGHQRGSRRAISIDLPPGALLLGYTDGLVERRTEVIDVGLKALIDVVEAAAPESVCNAVMARLAPARPADDIAVLVVRRDSGTAYA